MYAKTPWQYLRPNRVFWGERATWQGKSSGLAELVRRGGRGLRGGDSGCELVRTNRHLAESVGTSRLYECISEMKKGSQSGYDAETGEESAVRKRTRRTHEQCSLYRIRRPQEKHQLLRENGGGRDRGRRHDPGAAECAAGWAAARRQPWRGALEATLFSGWIYDTLKAYSGGLEMAHPAKMKAISSGREERHDRCADHRRPVALQPATGLLCGTGAYPRTAAAVALSQPGGERSGADEEQDGGLLMETGAEYVKEKLHGKKYFATLLEELEEVPESVIDLLRLSRGALEMFESTQRRLIQELLAEPS